MGKPVWWKISFRCFYIKIWTPLVDQFEVFMVDFEHEVFIVDLEHVVVCLSLELRLICYP